MTLLFDSAASTAPSPNVLKTVEKFFTSYGSIHRGCGKRSRISSLTYESAREVVRDHVRAPAAYSVVFTANTTDAITILSAALSPPKERRVLISDIEHSANDLPWRRSGWKVSTFSTVKGQIDPAAVNSTLSKGQFDLVAITGASNITGQIVDLEAIHRICKAHGVPLFADCSQRMAHAPTVIGTHCDALAFSGHKIHAPFGAGALVCPIDWITNNSTNRIGGGSVEYTNLASIHQLLILYQKNTPHNWEIGTPNGVGAVALAAALWDLDYEAIAKHDRAVEGWYKQYVLPHIPEKDVLWCSGNLLMLSIKQQYLDALEGVEFRYGAFCCYEAFRRVCGVPTVIPPPWDWGGIRLSADIQVSERDVQEIGYRLRQLLAR
jgi:cysteine desulfurase / selenocysteine lyase